RHGNWSLCRPSWNRCQVCCLAGGSGESASGPQPRVDQAGLRFVAEDSVQLRIVGSRRSVLRGSVQAILATRWPNLFCGGFLQSLNRVAGRGGTGCAASGANDSRTCSGGLTRGGWAFLRRGNVVYPL